MRKALVMFGLPCMAFLLYDKLGYFINFLGFFPKFVKMKSYMLSVICFIPWNDENYYVLAKRRKVFGCKMSLMLAWHRCVVCDL